MIEEHIEILKQNPLFLMAERKPESTYTQVITIKKELDKAIQERMRLSQIYLVLRVVLFLFLRKAIII